MPHPPHSQVDFFNEINLLYGVVAEFCTESSCPVMCAGPKYEYMWADGAQIRKVRPATNTRLQRRHAFL